jgi:hypothetical protein
MTTTRPTRIGKTTVVACAGSSFAQVRHDDPVVAIDADTAFGNSRCQVSSKRVIGRSCVPVTWRAAVNMVITPCAYSRPRDEISCGGTPPWLKWGCRRPAAASPAHYAKLPGITSRLCIGWPRGMLGDRTAIPTQNGEPRH